MRFNLFVCCFGKESAEAELKAAAHSLKPELGSEVDLQKSQSSQQQALSVRVLEGKQAGQEATFSPLKINESLPKKWRFGSSPEAIFRLEQEEGVGEMHFEVAYLPDLELFAIQNLGGGSGTFVQLDFPLVVADGLGISFGYHNYLELSQAPASGIRVQFLEGEKAGQSFLYEASDSPVTLGRMNDCSLKFDDSGLSRYQCVLERGVMEWRVIDGNGKKPSTNGTWVYVREQFLLQRRRTVVKAGAVLLELLVE